MFIILDIASWISPSKIVKDYFIEQFKNVFMTISCHKMPVIPSKSGEG
jgi:hypothetical protein